MFEKNAVVLVFLAVSVRFATSIRCFDCNSVNNSMCLDPTSYDQETLSKFLPPATCGSGLVSADQPSFFCRKMVQTILHKGYEPEVRVTRSCGWVRHKKECYKADNEDHLETVCQCFSDGCNSAVGSKALAALVAVSTILLCGKAVI